MAESYTAILRQMDVERSEKLRRAEQVRERFFADHPEADDAERSIAAATRRAFLAMRQEPREKDAILAALPEEIRAIRAEHNARIRSLGGDPDAFEPVWDCPDCCDTGYREDADGVRTLCPCVKKRAAEAAAAVTDLSPDPAATFEAFDETKFPDLPDPVPGEKYSQRELMRRARQYAEGYADKFTRGASNFLLTGSSGLGKTYLAACIANRVKARGFSVVALTGYRLSSLLRSAYLGDENAEKEEQALIDCDLLVIDDLGSEPIRKNIHLEGLFSVLNERNIQHKATLCATNLSFTALRDRYGERITSRLSGELLRLYGADIRMTR